jgi:hypothetical protein
METPHQYCQPGFTLLSYITELFSLLNLEKHCTFYTYAELCSKEIKVSITGHRTTMMLTQTKAGNMLAHTKTTLDAMGPSSP